MSDENIRIKVTVAGRVYRLKVGMHEEEFVRRGAEMIEERMQQLQASYTVSDDKDLLAMAALQIGTERARSEKEEDEDRDRNEEVMRRLEERISAYLSEHRERED
jgi:cell division protein ZapA (FtsZ GTPase activity inhibitor)